MRRLHWLTGVVVAVLLWAMPAQAQWQTPNHTVPIGRGAGVTGFGNAAPVAGGLFQSATVGANPAFTITPVLGVPGTSIGTLGFAGNTSGTATITPQAVAGTPTLTLPNASGTFAVGASAPLVLSSTTGNLTCPTCLTGTGGAITANLTTTSGFTAGQVLYSDGSKVQAGNFTGTLGNFVLSVSPTITGHPTIEGVTSTGATGTGNFVFSASPTLTGTLTASVANFSGALTALTLNGNTFTTGTYTLTGTAAKTLNFQNTITLAGTDSTTWTGPSTNATLAALNIQGQTLSGGVNVTVNALGNMGSAITLNCGLSPLQTATNNAAVTITAPVNDGSCIVRVTNGASAGAITFSGWTVGANTGDAYATTNTNKYDLFIRRIGGVASYQWSALQ